MDLQATKEYPEKLPHDKEVDSVNTPCPYCGGTSRFFISSRDFNRKTTQSDFQYYQCTRCHLVFMHPVPTDMRPFYKGGYQKIPKNLSELRAIAKKESYRMKPILEHKSGGKLLEIGPWMGIFSCNAKDAGFDVTAIDIDQNCIDFLNTTVGIRAIQSSNPAETLGQMNEKFDVIALWHALEHLPTPWLVIQRAAERLAHGGILLIAIPNIESYAFSITREQWLHLDAPRHLYFYRAESLVTLCGTYGLTPLQLTTNDDLSETLSRHTWHNWAVKKFKIKYLRGIIGLLRYYFERRNPNKEKSGCGMTALFQLQ